MEHAGTLSIIRGNWKYIEPGKGATKISKNTNTELGNDPEPQLHNLAEDIGEKRNVAGRFSGKVDELAGLLKKIHDQGRSRP